MMQRNKSSMTIIFYLSVSVKSSCQIRIGQIQWIHREAQRIASRSRVQNRGVHDLYDVRYDVTNCVTGPTSHVLNFLNHPQTSRTTYAIYNLSYQSRSTIVSDIAPADLPSSLFVVTLVPCNSPLMDHRYPSKLFVVFLDFSIILLLEIPVACRSWFSRIPFDFEFPRRYLRHLILACLLLAHKRKESNTSNHAGPVDVLDKTSHHGKNYCNIPAEKMARQVNSCCRTLTRTE